MREKIAPAAKVLDDLLLYNPTKGECPVTRKEAQEMWDAVSDLNGFAAVRAFLDACKAIGPKKSPHDPR